VPRLRRYCLWLRSRPSPSRRAGLTCGAPPALKRGRREGSVCGAWGELELRKGARHGSGAKRRGCESEDSPVQNKSQKHGSEDLPPQRRATWCATAGQKRRAEARPLQKLSKAGAAWPRLKPGPTAAKAAAKMKRGPFRRGRNLRLPALWMTALRMTDGSGEMTMEAGETTMEAGERTGGKKCRDKKKEPGRFAEGPRYPGLSCPPPQ
jgi:hypothetical protein